MARSLRTNEPLEPESSKELEVVRESQPALESSAAPAKQNPRRFVPSIPKSIPKLPDWNSDEPDVFEEMTLQEHLEEFRDRIIKAIIAIVPAFIFGFIIHGRVLGDIEQKSFVDEGLQTLNVGDGLGISFQISLYIALAITMPIILYHFIAFLMPGMTRKEKKILFTALPFVAILFFAGAFFGYFVAAPRALEFLSSWQSDILKWELTAQSAVTFFLRLVLGIGLAFQLPVFVFIVTKLGLVSTKQLRQWRKYAYLILVVVAAIITPTPDPINLATVALPLLLLYEGSIVISSVFGSKPKADDKSLEPAA